MMFALIIIVCFLFSQVEGMGSGDGLMDQEGSAELQNQRWELTKDLKEANDEIRYMLNAVEKNSEGHIFLTKRRVACNANLILLP